MKELIITFALSFFIAETAQGFVSHYKDEVLSEVFIAHQLESLEIDLN